MRHRRKGRKLGRNPNHQRALLRNLASALILTERDHDPDDDLRPKVPGRIITTLPKAKEVRPVVEKCITIARRSLAAMDAAQAYAISADRNTEAWRQWRKSDKWRKWSQAIAPAIVARRRVLTILGNKEAMKLVFDKLAPRFADRPGGYTRIVRLATPRLGDAGTRALIEFVGVRDRVAQRGPAPQFESEETAAAT